MNRLKNALTNALGNNDQPKQEDNTLFRNPIDLIETFERRSKLAALRSLAGAVQFVMINTADWIVRKEEQQVRRNFDELATERTVGEFEKRVNGQPLINPDLDQRNEQDEWARGEDSVMVGMEQNEDPHTKLKDYTHLYYGLVHLIRKEEPQQFERPKGLIDSLKDYTPRNVELSPDVMNMLAALEDEPGEYLKARDEGNARRAAKLNERKPRIKEVLELNADCNPMIEVFTQRPLDEQLRLATAAWKGVYFSRKQLVTWIASTGKAEEIGTVAVMKADGERLKQWCLDFEAKHADVFEALTDVGRRVYGIGDAEADAKKPRQQ